MAAAAPPAISSNGTRSRSQEESVAQDVARIRSHPLVPKNVPIYGYIYDVKTGKINEVPEATKLGKAA